MILILVNVHCNVMEININVIEWVIGHHQPVVEVTFFLKLKELIPSHFAVRFIDVD
jgi:hypothetical protein